MSISAEAMVQPSSYMGQGGFATAINYRMSIHNDNGWTSFDEVSTAKDGTKSYSYEMWMVEKINGEWKLVAASMYFYNQP
ncbi:MAG TPA: hypothetical protein VGI61_12180 [Parafilimonas sp.]|jgi:hypothetical protein